MKHFLSFFALMVTATAINCLLTSEIHAQISVSASDSISLCANTVFFTSSVSDSATTTVTTTSGCGSATSSTGVLCGTVYEDVYCGYYICGYTYGGSPEYCAEYCWEWVNQYAFATTTTVACAIASYHWSFGDGMGSSSLANPSYTYTAPGTYTVTLTVTDSCSHNTSFLLVVTIEPGSVILASDFCVGDTATATITGLAGGSWNSSDPGVATINGSGLLTAIASGVDTITYSVTDSCGTITSTKVVTVGIPPTVSTISGFTTVCTTTSTTLTDAISGGVWSVSNGNATVAGGVVHGVSAGLDTITYNLTIFCGSASATKVVSINSCSSHIISVLSDSIPSCSSTVYFTSTVIDIGTHLDTTLGTCGSGTSGTGVLCGTVLESVFCGFYICGFYYAGSPIYCEEYCEEWVNQYEAVTTTTVPCAIASYYWNFGDGLGTSSLADPSYIYTASGTYTAALTVTDSCGDSSTSTVVVTIEPGSILLSPAVVCVGATDTAIVTGTTGGSWHSSNPGIATINSAGLITGIATGVDTISYSITEICGTATSIKVITVSAMPSVSIISGSALVCGISVITLSDTFSGGVWSSSNTAIATVNTSGEVTGISPGTDSINYTVTNICGSVVASRIITVNPLAIGGIITGIDSICAGDTTTLRDTTGAAGGIWSISPATVATISSTGLVSGVGGGLANVSYSVTNICGTETATFNVTILLAPVAGTASSSSDVACDSGSVTLSLSDYTIGGTISLQWEYSTNNITWSTISGATTSSYVYFPAATYYYRCMVMCSSLSDTSYSNSVEVFYYTNCFCIPAYVNSTSATSYAMTAFDLAGFSGTSINDTPIVPSSGYTDRTALIPAVDMLPGGSYAGTVTYNTAYTEVGVTTIHYYYAWGTVLEWYYTTVYTDYYYQYENQIWIDFNDNGIFESSETVTGVFGNTLGTSTTTPYTINIPGTANPGMHRMRVRDAELASSSGLTSSVAFSTTMNPCTDADGTNSYPYGSTFDYWVKILVGAGNITGDSLICTGSTTTLIDTVTGGTWSSRDTSVATISGTGVVTGVASGVDSIIYTVGDYSTSKIITVSFPISAGVITGTTNVCSGSTITLSYLITGGTWSSSNSSIDTINASGIVTGISVGTDTVSYTVTASCGSAVTSTVVTVNPLPVAPGITGTATVCAGSHITLIDTITGGAWNSASTGIASITSGGVISGVSAGSSLISYTVTNSCGSATTTTTITVNPLPYAGSITGTLTACPGSITSLSDIASGGTWSSGLTTVATIDTSGNVSAIAAGTTSVDYSVTNGCGTAVTSSVLTVNPLPVAGAITGTTNVCAGSNTTLSDTAVGGVWSSISTGIASITSGGVAGGISAGTSLISYTVTNSCGSAISTTNITVNPLPDASSITGTTTVCAGSVISLSDIASGGTWSSSSTGIATVNSAGNVSAIAAGTTSIDYSVTNDCGTAIASYVVTVNPLPVAGTITGTTTVCAGSNTTLSDTAAGGAWSSVSTGIVSITSGGVAGGISAGTSLTSYTVTNSCGSAIATTSVTVNPLPVAGTITGTAYVCPGSVTTLGDTSLGGAWSSSATGIATISSIGIVTGVSTGTTGVTYTVTNSCGTVFATKIITVNPMPDAGTITGTLSVCVGSGTSLSDLVASGTWSSGTPAHASVSTTGLVSGLSAGTTIISYLFTNICGSASTSVVVTVNPLPVAGSISGANLVCQSAAITLSESLSGGTWASSSPGNASIDSLGIVTGNTAGTTTVSYTVSSVCGSATATKSVTIHALTNAGTITGSNSICFSGVITLSDLVSGGGWSSSFPAVANVDGAGHVNGYSAGTVNIYYTFSDICGTATATLPVTVYNLPAPIAGASSLCIGNTTTLTDAATGPTVTWSSSNPSVASIGSSLTGIITGMATGISTISYSNGCGSTITTNITVNPTPSSITGIAAICTGNITTLSDSVSGGTWSSDSASIATIGITNGIVDGLSAGITTIRYSNGCGSPVTKNITINPLPSMISGLNYVCSGDHITLSDLVSGGAWSSSSGSIAVISGTGVITGLLPGVATITYTLPTICFLSMPISVNPLPVAGTISGPGSVCVAAHAVLTDTFSMGTVAWSSSNTLVATMTGGIVAGISADTVTITYYVTNSCGTATASKAMLVKPLAEAGFIEGIGNVCQASSITLTDTVAGGTWSRSNTKANVSGGIVTGITAGIDTIIYSSTNSCGTANTYFTVTINPSPRVGIIAGADSICVSSVSTYSDATIIGSGTWSCNNTCASIIAATGVLTAVIAGTDTIKFNVSNSCGSIDTSKIIHIIPQPNAGTITGADSLCAGTSILLAESVPGGSWVARNTNATVSATGLVAAVSPGTDSITYSVSNFCGTASSVMEMTIKPLAEAGTLIGSDSVCVGTSVTIISSSAGGEWSRSNTNAGLLGGIVMGAIAGVDTIIYTAMNTCDTSVTTKTIHIIPQPNAGTISGNDSICIGANDTLSPSVTGGIWGSSDTNALVLSGIVTGNFAGTDTILYAITNYCGTATTFHPVFVKPLPDAGIIAGTSWVCMEMATTLTDVSVGGIWSVSNNNSTISGSVVRGVTAGTDTVSYSVSNTCGNAVTTKIITIMPLPAAGTITGNTDVCVGNTITLTDTVTGGTWGSKYVSIATVSGGIVEGLAPGTDIISYGVSNTCGTATAKFTVNISVYSIPYLAGQTFVCIGGMNDTLNYSPYGGTWSATNANATISNGAVIGAAPGQDTIVYTITNACGTKDTSISVMIFSEGQCDSLNLVKMIGGDNEGIRIYPNPAHELFTVEFMSLGTNASVVLIDIFGQLIQTKVLMDPASKKIQFNTSGLAAGTYMVKAIIDNKIYREKIIVMNK